jgi:ribonuclease P/MRP protein subunit RPP1
MISYECGLHCLPEGSDSPSRLALVARRLGYQGLIICNHSGFEKVFMPEAADRVSGVEVAFGLEVQAPNPKVLRSRVSSSRPRYPFLAVHGGPDEINRAACDDSNVDVLMHPEESRHGLSIAAARSAQLNQVAMGFDLSPMIRHRGTARSRWLEVLKKTLVLARKFDLAIMITAGPRSHLGLRAPRDLMALAVLAGFEEEEAKEALALPHKILGLNRKVWAGPGVEVL